MTVMSMDAELIPAKAVFAPGEPVTVELRGVTGEGTLTLSRRGDPVRTMPVGAGEHDLGALDAGGWGVRWEGDGAVLRTAVDVRSDADRRMRYGFTASYAPDRPVQPLLDTARRLHLTHVQAYDWAYRHADLLGGGPRYRDPLGGEIAWETVRAIVDGLRGIGTATLGYAAVYGVGPDEWPVWQEGGLVQADGTPVSLGDFLRIVDPAWAPWLEHVAAELRAATERLGFEGFHLDQYGWPRIARRADGTVVDVAASFVTLIGELRSRLPEAQLVFNNVNDFPTTRTAGLPQDAVYIEPWAPNTGLGDLARLADRARRDGGGKPVVLAAYQHCYETAPVAGADLALRYSQAALLSRGATQLIAGEGDRILTDPYYVRNRAAAPSTWRILREHADLAVEWDALLLDPRIADATDSLPGDHDELGVALDGIALRRDAEPGTVWCRVTSVGTRYAVHLIDLVDQTDVAWDQPKAAPVGARRGELRIRRVLDARLRVRLIRPGADPVELDVRESGTHATVALAWDAAPWTILLVEPDA